MNTDSLRLYWAKSPLQELFEKQKEQHLSTAQPVAAMTAAGGDKVELSSHQVLAQASSSMMSRSFTHAGSASDNMSDYVQANIAAAAKTLPQSLNKIMAAFLSEVGVNPQEVTSPAGAEQAMRRLSNKKTSEAHERNLGEMEDKLEKKTQEAVASTDTNGYPIQIGPEGAEVSAPELELAPQFQAASSNSTAALPENLLPEALAPQAPSITLIV